MIIQVPACRCSVCGAIFSPKRTRNNPTADPRKSERCGACASRRWNDDDPDVIAAKAKASEPTRRQRAVARKVARSAVQRSNNR
jgi:hypothetical protein